MERLVISGIGPVSPFGAGKECLRQALAEGRSGIKEITRFSSISGAMGGEITDRDIDALLDDRKFRRAADVSKYAMAAVKLALNDAGIESVSGGESAMVAAVTHGALNYTQEYHESLLTGGVEDISPILFSDSVLNAPAGNVSICFGIQGAVHTIVGGAASSIQAAMLACRLLGEGPIRRAVLFSSEEINELSFYCRSRSGEPVMAEGAGAVLIERADARTGSQEYCHISGFASHLDPSGPEASFRISVDRALSMARLKKADLDFILSDLPAGIHNGYLDETLSGTVSRFTGNAFAASSIWNIIAAADSIEQGRLPERLGPQGKESVPLRELKNVLVCALEKTGAAASIILSRG